MDPEILTHEAKPDLEAGDISKEGEGLPKSRAVRLFIGICIAILLIIAVTLVSPWLKTSHNDENDAEYPYIEGSIYTLATRLGDPNTTSDDVSELDIVDGPVGLDESHHFVFFYGEDGDDFAGWSVYNLTGPLKVKVDPSFVPANDDILLDEISHTKENTYKAIEIISTGG